MSLGTKLSVPHITLSVSHKTSLMFLPRQGPLLVSNLTCKTLRQASLGQGIYRKNNFVLPVCEEIFFGQSEIKQDGISKCWKEGCHLGQHYRDAWRDLAGEGLALSSLLLLRSPCLAGSIKPRLQSGAVLAGCASGRNELKWGTLPPPWTHHTHREIQGSLHWVSCLFSSGSVPCIFNLLVSHSAHLPIKSWSVQACLRQPKVPSWCQWWIELESSSSVFGTW